MMMMMMHSGSRRPERKILEIPIVSCRVPNVTRTEEKKVSLPHRQAKSFGERETIVQWS
jgi:hypothetical protein